MSDGREIPDFRPSKGKSGLEEIAFGDCGLTPAVLVEC
jgi:hypothetical protein